MQKTNYLLDKIVAPEARSIPARGESVGPLPSIFQIGRQWFNTEPQGSTTGKPQSFAQSKVGTDMYKFNKQSSTYSNYKRLIRQMALLNFLTQPMIQFFRLSAYLSQSSFGQTDLRHRSQWVLKKTIISFWFIIIFQNHVKFNPYITEFIFQKKYGAKVLLDYLQNQEVSTLFLCCCQKENPSVPSTILLNPHPQHRKSLFRNHLILKLHLNFIKIFILTDSFENNIIHSIAPQFSDYQSTIIR